MATDRRLPQPPQAPQPPDHARRRMRPGSGPRHPDAALAEHAPARPFPDSLTRKRAPAFGAAPRLLVAWREVSALAWIPIECLLASGRRANPGRLGRSRNSGKPAVSAWSASAAPCHAGAQARSRSFPIGARVIPMQTSLPSARGGGAALADHPRIVGDHPAARSMRRRRVSSKETSTLLTEPRYIPDVRAARDGRSGSGALVLKRWRVFGRAGFGVRCRRR